ncbi:MAG: gluconate 2-dehydrogenase subunit 3 family protein [Acidimicrobiales bacterium]
MGTTPGGAETRYPGFDVVGQATTWDPTTAAVVLGRLTPSSTLRFFTADEEPTARALTDRLLGQDDDPRVPVLEMVDARLADGVGDGYRHHAMPEDPDAWRRSLTHLDGDAVRLDGRRFALLGRGEQLGCIETVRTTEGDWHGLPAAQVFALWMRYACSAFYSHPWAWNEIGFGGPAYPRGYKNLGFDSREPWEVRDSAGTDPVPWAARVEAVRRHHRDALGSGGQS